VKEEKAEEGTVVTEEKGKEKKPKK
jgi:aspartyl-tRNA synthetase